jgi:hypothetical protein
MLIGSTADTSGGGGLAGAIRGAARATGTSFEYLLATAQVESGFNPRAAARNSSARGLFQFVDGTWLATMKESGASLGYGQYANAITRTSNGNYQVSDPAMRQKIMALRDDPKVNADMAGAFTRSNATRLENMIGRAPNDGELYMAHFLGAGGAAKLINLTSSNGSASAARAFPAAAHANRSIFYDRSGHAKSVNHVYAAIMQRYDTARSNAASMIANMNMTPNPAVPALPPGTTTLAAQEIAPVSQTKSTGPIFHSMFTSDGRSGAVSNLVRELWASRPRVAAALTGIPVDAVTNTSSTTAADASGKRNS